MWALETESYLKPTKNTTRNVYIKSVKWKRQVSKCSGMEVAPLEQRSSARWPLPVWFSSGCICGNIHKFQLKIFSCWWWNGANILTHMNIHIWLTQVMTSFGWSPSEEELKDMVNVIDQVLNLSLIRQSMTREKSKGTILIMPQSYTYRHGRAPNLDDLTKNDTTRMVTGTSTFMSLSG